MRTLVFFVASILLSASVATAAQPLRPPNGTYIYAMKDGGKTAFTSTVDVKGNDSAFFISESVRLPGGQIATTRSEWSSETLLPRTFEVRQGKVDLRGHLTPEALTFSGMGMKAKFSRIPGTDYVLPSVGLITTLMMFPYVEEAHPGESLTLAEIQNNQTVLIRPVAATLPEIQSDDVTIAFIKNKIHGDSSDRERIVAWLNRKTGIMDGGRATPGTAGLSLIRYAPAH